MGPVRIKGFEVHDKRNPEYMSQKPSLRYHGSDFGTLFLVAEPGHLDFRYGCLDL